MGYLGDLSEQLNNAFDLNSNSNVALYDQAPNYSQLGDFASQFDQSSQRSYLEEGFLRRDPYATDPKQLNILWQQPTATVLIKKKQFSSLAEHYRSDFMDIDEKLYMKAMSLLFLNKCTQIAALEKLAKIQQVTAAVGDISTQLVPIIITLSDQINNKYLTGQTGLSQVMGLANNADKTAFAESVERLRVVYSYNQTNPYTTWINDPMSLYQSTLANGTGVIELTNFSELSTTTAIRLGEGSCSFSIVDPYNTMMISEYDIELAISDATNAYYNNKAFQFGVTSASQTIADQQAMLNNIRNARNASPISFTVDPTSLFGHLVTAVIDRIGLQIPFQYDSGFLGLGGSVSVPDDYLEGGNLAGYDGLSTGSSFGSFNNGVISSPPHGQSEQTIFNTIIETLYSQQQLLSNAVNNTIANTAPVNYARRKLRFNFSGKQIIEQMDTVNIYINSKSQYDNKVLAGLQQLFGGMSAVQNFTNSFNQIANTANLLFNPTPNQLAEKTAYVGPNFPNQLWAMMRSQFVTENEGTHVFGGIVETVTSLYGNGAYKVNVNGKDNSYYFEQGKINFNPGADNFNGLLFDPLTPFKSNFDNVTLNATPYSQELLDENKYLLGESPSASAVKYKLGAMCHEKATQGNFVQDQEFNPVLGKLTKILYAPDGLVYKWKQGIGLFTRCGDSDAINDYNMVGIPNVYAEPFAGLDIMNVISLLVVGIPYNYDNFYKVTTSLGTFSSDPNNGKSAASSYMESLMSSLQKSNSVWGNFVPFKGLNMNQAAFSNGMMGQASVNVVNADLDSNLKQLAALSSSLTNLGTINALATQSQKSSNPAIAGLYSGLQTQASALASSINSATTALQLQAQQMLAKIRTSSSNNVDALNTIDSSNSSTTPKAYQDMIVTVNSLTKRMSYDVRANEDKNLFIVDDYYDSDYDIAAFNSALGNGNIPMNSFGTETTKLIDKIKTAAATLELEIFCDSQGHIRARPPQYNKIPSSVLFRMLYLKNVCGIQVFPQFLSSLFSDQLSGLKSQLEVVEDQIRFACAMIGQYPDISYSSDISAALWIEQQNVTAGTSTTFHFISDSTDTITDIADLISQANPKTDSGNSIYDYIMYSAQSPTQVLSTSSKYNLLLTAIQQQILALQGSNAANFPAVDVLSQGSVVQQLITRISTKSGQTISSADYIVSGGPNQPATLDTGVAVDLYKVVNDLQGYISQWQSLVKTFYHTIKNAFEFQSMTPDPSTTNSLLPPVVYDSSSIPDVYKHMIEDETFDDYGISSGTRYVIHNSQVISLTINQKAPEYNAVQVSGTYPFGKEGSNWGEAIQPFTSGGGTAELTAFAVDYDMWRHYGFKMASNVAVPFLTNPVTQCAPFAAALLSRNRAKVLSGSCTIAGNEYMQPGEVVYLEDRGLLFYVESVTHIFTYGSTYSTALSLTYGHSPGDYIPSMLDVVGKMIVKNQDSNNVIIHRQSSTSPEQNVGVVQLDCQNTTAPIISSGLGTTTAANRYAVVNQTVVNNILYKVAYAVNQNGASGNNLKAVVELRLYNDNKNAISGPLKSAADDVVAALTSQVQVASGPQNIIYTPQSSLVANQTVNIVTVNIDDTTNGRSPSQQAFDAARNQMATATMGATSTATANNDALRTALFNYVIDCWVTFTRVSDAIAATTHS